MISQSSWCVWVSQEWIFIRAFKIPMSSYAMLSSRAPTLPLSRQGKGVGSFLRALHDDLSLFLFTSVSLAPSHAHIPYSSQHSYHNTVQYTDITSCAQDFSFFYPSSLAPSLPFRPFAYEQRQPFMRCGCRGGVRRLCLLYPWQGKAHTSTPSSKPDRFLFCFGLG